MMDSIPLVAITGQVRTELIGNDAFQEADTTGITRPVTKYNCIVKDVRDLARVIKEVFFMASTGRPGPVVIDLPVMFRLRRRILRCVEMRLPGYKPKIKGHHRQIEMAAEAKNKSEKPVLYVGGGIISANAGEELCALRITPNVIAPFQMDLVQVDTPGPRGVTMEAWLPMTRR